MVTPQDNLRVRWFVYAFVAAGALMTAMLGWQLFETTPARWCGIAKAGTPELANACVAVLLRLLDIKNDVVVGLLAITGLSVLSLAAVALGVRLGFTGPAGLSADVRRDESTVIVSTSTPTEDKS